MLSESFVHISGGSAVGLEMSGSELVDELLTFLRLRELIVASPNRDE